MPRINRKHVLVNNDPWGDIYLLNISLVSTLKGEAVEEVCRPGANVFFLMKWSMYSNRGSMPCEFLTDGDIWFSKTKMNFWDRSTQPPARRYVRDAIRRYVNTGTTKIRYTDTPVDIASNMPIVVVDKNTLAEVRI